MRILGIDPGLDITGYGIVEESTDMPVVIEAGIIRTSSREPLFKRLKSIYSQLDGLIKETGPAICVVEELYSHYKHPMTAILMGHARGAVLLCCSCNGVDVAGYPAKTVKRAVTGNGNASKVQVQRVVSRFLNLDSKERPVDVTDAIALCLAHISHGKKLDRKG